MGIILWIVFGALVGWTASVFMESNSQQGLTADIVIGIVGAVIGGWVMSMFGELPVTGFNIYSFIVAVIGAVILIAVARMTQIANL